MRPLEQRYRRLLRLLPAWYRARREDEMVDTFLESMADHDDPERHEEALDLGRPTMGEAASVVALAARLRLGGAGSPARSVMWGAAVRRVALVGLMTEAVAVTAVTAVSAWAIGRVGWLPRSPVAAEAAVGTWSMTWRLLGIGAVIAYAALLFGNWRAARWIGGLLLAVGVVSTGVAAPTQPAAATFASLCGLLCAAVPLGALAAFHEDAPRAPRRPWLVAFVVGLLVASMPFHLLQPFDGGVLRLDWAGLCVVVVVLAAAVHLAGRLTGRVRADSPWPLTLTLLAATVLVQRLG
ncbi:MAG TPA: hypothetical protein VFT95_07185, partial [Micromonosporaceae bacterium]|nr:hypothetical protein [Micromonosporaceae bacterium]